MDCICESLSSLQRSYPDWTSEDWSLSSHHRCTVKISKSFEIIIEGNRWHEIDSTGTHSFEERMHKGSPIRIELRRCGSIHYFKDFDRTESQEKTSARNRWEWLEEDQKFDLRLTDMKGISAFWCEKCSGPIMCQGFFTHILEFLFEWLKVTYRCHLYFTILLKALLTEE